MFGIVTDDLPKSLACYRRLGLDIPADADSAPHVEIQLPGGLRLAWDPADTIRSFDSVWSPPTGGGYRIAIAFEFPDTAAVDAAYAEILGAGSQGYREPWHGLWGQRSAAVKAADGNHVDLFAALCSLRLSIAAKGALADYPP